MANKLFAIIRTMPDDVLADFRDAIQQDIKSRRASGREFTSLFRLFSVAALELELRRKARSSFGAGGGNMRADKSYIIRPLHIGNRKYWSTF